jgi:hypothetical protein
MKHVHLVLITFAAIGCGHNEFDVSPAEVSRHAGAPKPAGADQFRLPPGAVKTEMKFKKGDRLPDGTIADSNVRISSDGH